MSELIKTLDVPKSLMGSKAFCPRGGQEGIFVTESQLEHFAKKLGNKFIDQVIPLPLDQQFTHGNCPYKKDHERSDHVIYWETDKGSHGWCCEGCGTVLQWG